MTETIITFLKEEVTRLKAEYADLVRSPSYMFSLALALFMMYVVYVLNFYAGTYATLHADRWVHDLILSNTPRFDTGYIHEVGASALRWFILLLLLTLPRRAPFVLKSLALLVLVRCVFISLTQLGVYPGTPPIFSNITFGGDLYFSGHVAIPIFLGFIFWSNKWLRYFFFALSVFFAASVLLGHVHYSIDVFSAPFFAYGVFVLSRKFFAKDYRNQTT